jgi:hydroxymethylbilane synthase
VLEREDARDVLVTASGLALADLAAGVRIGTTSLRRAAQALAVKPSAAIGMLRGNVETRLRKLCEGQCDATFLAAAGLKRLGLSLAPARGVWLDPFEFVPAAGQGALAITVRSGDAATLEILSVLDHGDSRLAALAERAFARVFGGGCHLPLAAYAERKGDGFALAGLMVAPDGRTSIRDDVRIDLDPAASPARAAAVVEEAGAALARSFFARGAADILRAAESGGAPS